MLQCPHCKHIDSNVLDSRPAPGGTRRRRECLKCRDRFTTIEMVVEIIEPGRLASETLRDRLFVEEQQAIADIKDLAQQFLNNLSERINRLT